MGLLDKFRKRLRNSRIRRFDSSKYFYGDSESIPDDTGTPLSELLTPVVERSIASARYAYKNVAFVQGLIKNRVDKIIVRLELIDKNNSLNSDDLYLINKWLKLINIRKISTEIMVGGLVDGELLIKPLKRYDKEIGTYIKPVFLEIGSEGYGLAKIVNDDGEVERLIHRIPKSSFPEDMSDEDLLRTEWIEEVFEDYVTVSYETNEVLNPCYNERDNQGVSPTITALDDIYFKCDTEIQQHKRVLKDNIIEVQPMLDADGVPYVEELSSSAKTKLKSDYGSETSNVAVVPPGITSKLIGGNAWTSSYHLIVNIYERNIMRCFVTPQTENNNRSASGRVADTLMDSNQTGFIVNIYNDRLWLLDSLNDLLNRQLELFGLDCDVLLRFANNNVSTDAEIVVDDVTQESKVVENEDLPAIQLDY